MRYARGGEPDAVTSVVPVSASLLCPRCRQPLSSALGGGLSVVTCPYCDATVRATLFPALLRPLAVQTPEPVQGEGEAGCFTHPEVRAVIDCQECGRFLCALCDLELMGRHICPLCLQNAAARREWPLLERSRTLHDNIALSVAVLPTLFFVFPSLFGAPASLFLALRHWNTPRSIVPRSRWRLVLAIVLAMGITGAWLYLTVLLIQRIPGVRRS